MEFGITGGRSLVSALALPVLLLAAVGTVTAQDAPPNSLPMPVPTADQIDVSLEETIRGKGLLVTWPLPPDSTSTSVTLVDTAAGLDFPITVSGAYADDFDRTLRFEFLESDVIGTQTRNRFRCIWTNRNSDRTGLVGGEINVSNTSGLWIRDGGGAWDQHNQGFPRYLPYSNLLDVTAIADGTTFAVLTSGTPPQVQNNPQGVYRSIAGGDWIAIAPEVFGRTRSVARVVAHPTNADRIAVGTRQSGLYVSSDGGASFTQWTSNLDPDFPNVPAQPEVTAMLWTEARLYVAIRAFGLFVSSDQGVSFTRLSGVTVPDGSGNPQIPFIRSLAADPGDSDRILAGLNVRGVYELVWSDPTWTWTSLNGDFIAFPDDDPGDDPDPGLAKTVLTIAVDPDDGDVMVMGTSSQGFWSTTDNGATWYEAASPYNSEVDFPNKPEVWHIIRHAGQLLALVNGFGLHVSSDQGQSWTLVADQPYNRLGQRLASRGSDLLLGATSGGIFAPPITFPISATISSATTEPAYRGLDLGLSLTFGPGSVTLTDVGQDGQLLPVRFDLICEDYQGWVVWRSSGSDPDNMTMIGRFDKNNPETCIEGYCGDDSFVQLPNCYAERRAACFDFSLPGQASFFDEDIFNGFTYYYAITPFDYGDTSMLIDPLALNSPMVYPARFPDDPLAEGPGNRFPYQVNLEAAPALDGEEIYVYPNPLRWGSGIAGGEGEQVVWTNLPPESQVQIFTLSGERIAELPKAGEPQQGSNIYWITRNDDQQLLAAGIYMWRVIMPERGDYWGKLVIIR